MAVRQTQSYWQSNIPETELDSKHEYTIEILYHFTCAVCQEWWSWAHTPGKMEINLTLPDNEKVWCPQCGHTQTLKVKKGFPI